MATRLTLSIGPSQCVRAAASISYRKDPEVAPQLRAVHAPGDHRPSLTFEQSSRKITCSEADPTPFSDELMRQRLKEIKPVQTGHVDPRSGGKWIRAPYKCLLVVAVCAIVGKA